MDGEGFGETPVWYTDRESGTAVGEVIATIGDWTGSWTGYGEVSADRYITDDLQGGRVPAVIDAGGTAVFISHWQGFYGLHNEDRRGFCAFKEVVRRLRDRDPGGERTRWRKCSEITDYACAREMARCSVDGDTIHVDLPVRVSELTVRISGVGVRGILVDGRPLTQARTRAAFENNTFYTEGRHTLAAFDPQVRRTSLQVLS
jgi:hypothetical protein